MTLVLINGCLEPGADGVGDYDRRLAAACTRLGVTTALLALNDPHVSEPLLSEQSSDGIAVPTLRLPSTLPWRHRGALARAQLQAWHCRALSLQFVPYAFDPRGLPLALLALLRELVDQPGLRVHLMLHEIWIGIASTSDLRSRAIGHLQRRLIQAIAHSIRPSLVTTTNGTYVACLRGAGLEATRLPLFSGLDSLATAATPTPAGAGATYSACLFGRIPPPWDPDPALEAVVEEAARQGLPPRLLLIGRHWVPEAWFTRLRQRWPQIAIEEHGIEEDPGRLSQLVSACQLGLAPVPWGLVEKSSAVAAFLTLGLPVLASREDWQLRRRWRGDGDEQLPDHSNLLRLSAWRDRGRRDRLPLYVPMTPRRVAEAMLPSLVS